MRKQIALVAIILLSNTTPMLSMILISSVGNFLSKHTQLIGLSALFHSDAIKLIIRDQTYSNLCVSPGDDAEIFVKETLKEHRFPEKFIQDLKVKGLNSFSAGTNFIWIPINNFTLNKAKTLYSGKEDKTVESRKNCREYSDTLLSENKLAEKAFKYGVNKEILEKYLHATYPIQALMPESYLTWKGIIIHEGAHVYYKHINQIAAYCLLAPFVAEYAGKYLKWDQFNLHTMPRAQTKFWNLFLNSSLFGYKYGFASMGLLLLAKFQENQADREVVKRCDNPQILKAMSNWFDAGAKLDQRSYVDQLLDTHKRYHVRAEYFRKAAEALEQEKKS